MLRGKIASELATEQRSKHMNTDSACTSSAIMHGRLFCHGVKEIRKKVATGLQATAPKKRSS